MGERKKAKQDMNQAKTPQQKRTASASYSAVAKDIKKQLRADKRAYIIDIADQAEKTARKEDKKTLYHDQIPQLTLEQSQQQVSERKGGYTAHLHRRPAGKVEGTLPGGAQLTAATGCTTAGT